MGSVADIGGAGGWDPSFWLENLPFSCIKLTKKTINNILVIPLSENSRWHHSFPKCLDPPLGLQIGPLLKKIYNNQTASTQHSNKSQMITWLYVRNVEFQSNKLHILKIKPTQVSQICNNFKIILKKKYFTSLYFGPQSVWKTLLEWFLG